MHQKYHLGLNYPTSKFSLNYSDLKVFKQCFTLHSKTCKTLFGYLHCITASGIASKIKLAREDMKKDHNLTQTPKKQYKE